jgi:hypothetical protein
MRDPAQKHYYQQQLRFPLRYAGKKRQRTRYGKEKKKRGNIQKSQVNTLVKGRQQQKLGRVAFGARIFLVRTGIVMYERSES